MNKSIVDKIYSFEQAAEAHRRVETEKRLGTVVISNDVNSDSLAHGKVYEIKKYYNKLNDQKIREIALELGLDQTEFEKKMKDSKITEMIRQDVREGA